MGSSLATTDRRAYQYRWITMALPYQLHSSSQLSSFCSWVSTVDNQWLNFVFEFPLRLEHFSQYMPQWTETGPHYLWNNWLLPTTAHCGPTREYLMILRNAGKLGVLVCPFWYKDGQHPVKQTASHICIEKGPLYLLKCLRGSSKRWDVNWRKKKKKGCPIWY